jgi:hypothetical protein
MSSAGPLLPPEAPADRWPAVMRACLPPAVAAAAWHALLLAAYLLPYGGDLSALVCVDREQLGGWPYEAIRVGFPTPGFDGQFYYTLARDPWRPHGAILDFPAYRHARILYPALAWLLSGGGNPRALLWALPAINVLAAAGLAWLGARLAFRYGRSAWWGFLLPLVVNVGMPAMRDLTDPLAALTAAGLLAAWLLRRPAWVVFAWGAAAVLSREQNAALVVILLAAAVYGRRWRPAAALAASALLLAGWLTLLRQVYGTWPFSPHNVGLPLTAMADRFRQPLGPHFPVVAAEVLRRLVLPTQIVLCGALIFLRVHRSVKLIGLAGAVLAVVAGDAVYGDQWSYLRVFAWMPLAVWTGGVISGRRWPVLLLFPVVLCSLQPGYSGLRSWMKRGTVPTADLGLTAPRPAPLPPSPCRRADEGPAPRSRGHSRPRPASPAVGAARPSRPTTAAPGSAARTPAPPACTSAPGPAPAARRTSRRSSRTASG